MSRTAIVIGGGIGGMATANLLAHEGWTVTVLEQADQLGGRAGWLEIDGFGFDTGPSWFLMPEVFEHYFGLLGRRLSDYLTLDRLDPAYCVFPEGRPPVTIHGDLERDATTFEAIEPGAGGRLRRYVDSAQTTYEMSMKHFLYTNFSDARSLVSPDIWRSLPALPRSLSLNSHVARQFKDPLLRQIMQYPSVFLGTSPYRAPSLYGLMSYLDFSQGVFFPRGGMYSLIRALEKVGGELGVEFRLNTAVERIITANGRASGVELADGSTLTADLIISNADLHHTEQALLSTDSRSLPQKFWAKAEPGPSAMLMYLGVKGRLPQLSHHNLIFNRDWEKTFGDIFDRRQWPSQASMYVCAPSITDPSVAPADHENLFVLVPLPPLDASGTMPDLTAAADRYLAQIETAIGAPDLRQRLVVKRLFGPADFAKRFGSWRGSALGLGHTWSQSAILRPSVRSRKISNLYYVGANVRPGIGLPMCLISAQLILKDLHNDRTPGPAPLPEVR